MCYKGFITEMLSLESRDDLSLINCPEDINPMVFSVYMNTLYGHLETFDSKYNPEMGGHNHFCFLLPVYDTESLDTLILIPLVGKNGCLEDITVLRGYAEDMDYLTEMDAIRIDDVDDKVLEELVAVSIDFVTLMDMRVGRYVYLSELVSSSFTVTDLYTLRSYDLPGVMASTHIPKNHATNYDSLWPLVRAYIGKVYNRPIDFELVEIKRREGLTAIRRGLDTNCRLFKILGIPMVCESIQYIGVSKDDMVVSISEGVLVPPSAVEWVDLPVHVS